MSAESGFWAHRLECLPSADLAFCFLLSLSLHSFVITVINNLSVCFYYFLY